jgi:hypothetical protein
MGHERFVITLGRKRFFHGHLTAVKRASLMGGLPAQPEADAILSATETGSGRI